MKKALSITIILLFSLIGYSQTVSKDNSGNYHYSKSTTLKTTDSLTGKTFTDYNEVVLPVYVSKTGKLYVIRTSKTGNKYRYYFKID